MFCFGSSAPHSWTVPLSCSCLHCRRCKQTPTAALGLAATKAQASQPKAAFALATQASCAPGTGGFRTSLAAQSAAA